MLVLIAEVGYRVIIRFGPGPWRPGSLGTDLAVPLAPQAVTSSPSARPSGRQVVLSGGKAGGTSESNLIESRSKNGEFQFHIHRAAYWTRMNSYDSCNFGTSLSTENGAYPEYEVSKSRIGEAFQVSLVLYQTRIH